MYFPIRAQKGLSVSLKWLTQIKGKVIEVVTILQIFSIHTVDWAQVSLASLSKHTWKLRLAYKHRYITLSDSSVVKFDLLLLYFAGLLRNWDLFVPANFCMQSKHKYAKTKIKEKTQKILPNAATHSELQ